MRTDIGLKDKNKTAVIGLLNNLLADEFLLYTKTRGCHWNVKGPQFSELHRFFQELYEELDKIVDDTAERIVTLGGEAPATMREFLAAARLKEFPGERADAEAMVRGLLEDHEELVNLIREDAAACADRYEDAGTNDFLVGLLQAHEKTAWKLRATLEK